MEKKRNQMARVGQTSSDKFKSQGMKAKKRATTTTKVGSQILHIHVFF